MAAHVVGLTADLRLYPAGLWAAQCRDGHDFEEMYRGSDLVTARRIVAAHNESEHERLDAQS